MENGGGWMFIAPCWCVVLVVLFVSFEFCFSFVSFCRKLCCRLFVFVCSLDVFLFLSTSGSMPLAADGKATLMLFNARSFNTWPWIESQMM